MVGKRKITTLAQLVFILAGSVISGLVILGNFDKEIKPGVDTKRIVEQLEEKGIMPHEARHYRVIKK